MTATVTSVLGTVVILAVIPGFSVLYREFLDRSGVRASAAVTTIVSVLGAVVWLGVSGAFAGVATSPLELPTAALAALASFLTSLTVRDSTAAALPAILFSLGWTVLVFVPVVLVSLYPASLGIPVTDEVLDLGGALPLHVGVGASALVILTVARRWAVPDHSHIRPRSWLLLTSAAVIWIGSVLGFVALEVTIDGVVTPVILTNGVVAPICGAVGWMVVQRIRTATTTPIGAAAGLVSGIAAISSGAAYFSPLWGGITGAVAGIVASVFVSRRVRATGRHAWFLVGAHLIAASIGLLMLGLFSNDFGLIYQGQTTLLVTQFTAIAGTAAWSLGISTVLWLVVRVLARRRAVGP